MSEFPALPPPYLRLLASPQAIGWDHLVRGRLSFLWSEIQQDCMDRLFPKTKFDPAKWHRKVINPMLLVDCPNVWLL
jgi:hypothetical protein